MGIYYRGNMIRLNATPLGTWVASVTSFPRAGRRLARRPGSGAVIGEFERREHAIAAARAYVDESALPSAGGRSGRLPRAERTPAEPSAGPTDAPPGPGRGGPWRNASGAKSPGDRPHEILLIEDDRVARWSLMRALLCAGYRVRVAATATEGLAEAGSTPPELVLLDAQLPDADGESVLQTLQRSHPDLPVVMMSADATSETEQRLRDRGASGFLAKPCAAVFLLTLVASLL
jgi:CheY-like chemotaxis protein